MIKKSRQLNGKGNLNEKEKKYERVKLDACNPPLDHAFVIFKNQTRILSLMITDWIANLN